VGKSKGKRPLGRNKHRWKGNISMVIKKNMMTDFALDKHDFRLGTSGRVDTCGKGNETWGFTKCREFHIS
jgi:hypothetical protein